MSDLERRLHELGAGWDVPPTPDIASRVGPRLSHQPVPRHPRLGRRRRVVLSIALAAVTAGALAAIAPAREAILELFGIGGETIRPVPALPPARTTVEPATDLGERMTLQEAQRRSSFAIRLPRIEGLGPPDEVFRSEPPPGGRVSFVWKRARTCRRPPRPERGS